MLNFKSIFLFFASRNLVGSSSQATDIPLYHYLPQRSHTYPISPLTSHITISIKKSNTEPPTLDGLHPAFLAFSSFPGVPELQRVAVTGTRKYPPGVEPAGIPWLAGFCNKMGLDSSKMNIWLVVSTPLKNMNSSVGIIIPNISKIKNVPNHQPEHNWVVLPRRHNLSHLAFYLPRVWLK